MWDLLLFFKIYIFVLGSCYLGSSIINLEMSVPFPNRHASLTELSQDKTSYTVVLLTTRHQQRELVRQLCLLSTQANDQWGTFMTYSLTGSSRFFLISFSLPLGWKKELAWRMEGDEPPNKSTIRVCDHQAMMVDMYKPNLRQLLREITIKCFWRSVPLDLHFSNSNITVS